MARCGVEGVFQRALALHRGVAREGRRAAAAGRSAHPAGRRPRRGPRRDDRGRDRTGPLLSHRAGTSVRRALIPLLLGLALALPAAASGEERIRGMRVWPAKDYTRVTLESDSALRYT